MASVQTPDVVTGAQVDTVLPWFLVYGAPHSTARSRDANRLLVVWCRFMRIISATPDDWEQLINRVIKYNTWKTRVHGNAS